jgi:hypothetical protein
MEIGWTDVVSGGVCLVFCLHSMTDNTCISILYVVLKNYLGKIFKFHDKIKEFV